MTLQIWINVVALVVGVLAGGAFLFRYMTKVHGWWREEHRAHVVAFSGNLWLLYLLYAVRTLSSPLGSPGSANSAFNVLRTVLFVTLTSVVVWRWYIFERGLRRVRQAA